MVDKCLAYLEMQLSATNLEYFTTLALESIDAAGRETTGDGHLQVRVEISCPDSPVIERLVEWHYVYTSYV